MRASLADIATYLSVPGPDGPYMDPKELAYVTSALQAKGLDPATASASDVYAAASSYGNSVWQAATGIAPVASAQVTTPANILIAPAPPPYIAATPVYAAPAAGTAAITKAFPTAGYIDQQGNLWQLGSSGQVGGPDAVNLGAVNASNLTATAAQALATALTGHTSQSGGYLLLDSTGLAAAVSAYGTNPQASSLSGGTLLLVAAGAAAIYFMSRH